MPKPYREDDNSRARRRAVRGKQEPADWGTADAEAVLALIRNVTNEGGAVRFGYTRQGGAYAIGYLGDGEPYTDYVRPSEDINAYLAEAAIAWGDSTDTVTATESTPKALRATNTGKRDT